MTSSGSPAVEPALPAELRTAIDEFFAADRRQRHALLKALTPRLDREGVRCLAPALRDPSPRTAARVVSLLARHDLEETFEAQLAGLKPGKIELLRRQFRRMRGEDVVAAE